LVLDVSAGGVCPKCQRKVASRLLQNQLSLTVSLATHSATADDQHLDLANGCEETKALVGQRLGHFEIAETLGTGGMGAVYRALDTSLQRYVAVKVLQRKKVCKSGSEGEVDRLLQEAISQARVNHPNVVSIYYVGKQDGEPFLAMELVPGVTVEQHLASGELAFPEVASIGLQMTDALAASLEFDVLHGDIKPSNIMWQSNGVAKLSDFGMARRSSTRENQQIGGTPNYLAPELLNGQPMTFQSDMYSLGVTLYELTFGKLPVTLSGYSFSEWAESHRRRVLEFPQPWPDHLPEMWRDILKRLLQQKPEDRYSSYEELRRDLLQVLPSRNTAARVLPRLFAAAIDFVVVAVGVALMFLVSFLLVSQLRNLLDIADIRMLRRMSEHVPWYQELGNLIVNVGYGLSLFIPAGLYLFATGYFRQTIGRGLMHVRVVNCYGLWPQRRTLALREIPRMALVLTQPITANMFLMDLHPALIVLAVTIPVAAFSLFNMGYLLFSKQRRALHDRMFRTNVVLDTQ
jgi:uncharacterized RDD family membrane protein YckC